MIEVHNATIESTRLEVEDHGILTAWINTRRANSTVQGFGGFCFSGGRPTRFSPLLSEFIYHVTILWGQWEKLPGKPIRVLVKDQSIAALGHYIDDTFLGFRGDLFILADEAGWRTYFGTTHEDAG